MVAWYKMYHVLYIPNPYYFISCSLSCCVICVKQLKWKNSSILAIGAVHHSLGTRGGEPGHITAEEGTYSFDTNIPQDNIQSQNQQKLQAFLLLDIFRPLTPPSQQISTVLTTNCSHHSEPTELTLKLNVFSCLISSLP